MTEKKHKGGYELLKEKYDALYKERDELKKKLTDVINEKDSFADDCKRLYKERDEWKTKYAALQAEKEILVYTAQENYCHVERERDEWKAKYEQKCNEHKQVVERYNNALGKIDEQDLRIAFLLDHCPFWVRWMYRRHFEKGGKE